MEKVQLRTGVQMGHSGSKARTSHGTTAFVFWQPRAQSRHGKTRTHVPSMEKTRVPVFRDSSCYCSVSYCCTQCDDYQLEESGLVGQAHPERRLLFLAELSTQGSTCCHNHSTGRGLLQGGSVAQRYGFNSSTRSLLFSTLRSTYKTKRD
uniref:Uncharacterized protein n=1 Tax=Cacopsylla melanoneura TaxID=428564 RepID=A0A8D8YL39_9HEMI